MSSAINWEERFEASMILLGVGDALGYKNGEWEFCRNGQKIHEEMKALTANAGVLAIKITKRWFVSDDTVMSLATSDGMLNSPNFQDFKETCKSIAKYYKACMNDMSGRGPGITCMRSLHEVGPDGSGWDAIQWSPSGGGCGGSMRSGPIGLVFCRPEQLGDLVAYSIEAGRMTHNHPTGYLGSLTTALFCSYAIQRIPIVEWPRKLLREAIPRANEYIIASRRDVEKNLKAFSFFENSWTEYVVLRKISQGETEPTYPNPFGIAEREAYYKSISFDGWGGASGDDSVIIAYDAVLGANGSWEEFLLRGALHGGDSDSTSSIGAAWWGLVYGLDGVPLNHYQQLEYFDRLKASGKALYQKCVQLGGVPE